LSPSRRRGERPEYMSTVFEHMATLVKVRNLQPTLDAIEELAEAKATERICLVSRDEEIDGWTGFDMLINNALVSEHVEATQPGSVLSADTPALEAARLFTETSRHFFFVLDHNRITGTLHYEDLFGLPFRLCLLALTFQLEDSALEAALRTANSSWSVLPEGRRRKAIDLYALRYGQPQDVDDDHTVRRLLGCTTFTDKGTVLRKCRYVPGMSGEELESVFSRAEQVRNSYGEQDRASGERATPPGSFP
jgi:hypothetical protein